MRNATFIAGLNAICWAPVIGLFVWLRPTMTIGSALVLLMTIFLAVFFIVLGLLYRVEQEQLEDARLEAAARRLCADSIEAHGDVPLVPVALSRAPQHVRGELAA